MLNIFQCCCSFEKASRIISIVSIVLGIIGLLNTIVNFNQLGSFGTGMYIILVYIVQIGVSTILLQGVKKKSE